jgi:hypothetical protein
MTRNQLEQVRKSVQAQLRWAMLHDGDEELQELLCFENDRLSAMIDELSQSIPQNPPLTGERCADQPRVSCAILWGLATSAAHCARRRGSGRVWQDCSTPSEPKISSRRRIAFGQIRCVNINRTTTTSGTPSNQSMIGIATSRLLIRQHRLAKQLVRGSEVPGPGLRARRRSVPDHAGAGLL